MTPTTLVLSVIFFPLALTYYNATKLLTKPVLWYENTIKKLLTIAIVTFAIIALSIAYMLSHVTFRFTIINIIIFFGTLWYVQLFAVPLMIIYLKKIYTKKLLQDEVSSQNTLKIKDAIRQASLTDAWKTVKTEAFKTNNNHAVETTHIGIIVNNPLGNHYNTRNLNDPAAVWLNEKHFALPPTAGQTRLVCLGSSGSGKTETLKRITHTALCNGWRVCYIDGKGILAELDDFVNMLSYSHNLHNHIVSWPEKPVNIWTGDVEHHITKVMALLPPAEGNATHYRQQTQTILRIIAKDQPWRTTEELLNRLLTIDSREYSHSEQSVLYQKEQQTYAHIRVHNEISSALTPLKGYETSTGFTWEDNWRFARITIDPGTNAAAPQLAAALLHDLDAYRLRRTAYDEPLLVIIDETATLYETMSPPPLARFAEQFRSANIGLILAGQSLHSFGPEIERILHSGTTILLGNTVQPEPLLQLAGKPHTTVHAYHQTFSITENDTTQPDSKTSTSEQQYLISPDYVRKASPGDWFLLHKGLAVEVIIPILY